MPRTKDSYIGKCYFSQWKHMAGNLSFLLIITYNCIMVSNFYEGGIIYKNTLHCEVEFVAFSYLSYKNVFQGTFAGDLLVKTKCFHSRGCGVNSWSGN